MGRFSKLDLDQQAGRPAPEPLDDPWPNLDAEGCLKAADEQFERGGYEAALTLYSRALRFDRDLDAAWVGQIRCLLCLGEFPEAVLWADRALERMRNAPELLACKGLALVLGGSVADGIAFLDGAVAMRSPSALVWLARGEALLAARQPEENAHRCFLKAREQAPDDWRLEVRIGMAYNRARCWARARSPLLSAQRHAPDNPLALYHLGLAQEHLGEERVGAGLYERAVAVRPGFAEAAQALERVRRANFFTRLWRR